MTSIRSAVSMTASELGDIDDPLNIVNPIGEKRWGLMPDQPYSR